MINDNKMSITREHNNMHKYPRDAFNRYRNERVFLIRFIPTNIAELHHPNRRWLAGV